MDKNQFSLEDVCSIIKACGEAHVSVLKFRGLYVKFGAATQISVREPAYRSQGDENRDLSSTTATEMAETQTQIAENALKVDEANVKADELAQMFIEDPYKAEQLLLNGQLEDENGFIDDDE